MANNAFVLQEDSDKKDVLDRQRIEFLNETIEALVQIAGSNYWKVLQKNVFDGDLEKAKRSLAKEENPTEMFRLQGEIKWGEKFNLEKLLDKYRNELKALKK